MYAEYKIWDDDDGYLFYFYLNYKRITRARLSTHIFIHVY